MAENVQMIKKNWVLYIDVRGGFTELATLVLLNKAKHCGCLYICELNGAVTGTCGCYCNKNKEQRLKLDYIKHCNDTMLQCSRITLHSDLCSMYVISLHVVHHV